MANDYHVSCREELQLLPETAGKSLAASPYLHWTLTTVRLGMDILPQQIGGIVSESRLHVTQENALKHAEMSFPQLRDRLDIDVMVGGDLACSVNRPRKIARVAPDDWRVCQAPANGPRLCKTRGIQWGVELTLNPAGLVVPSLAVANEEQPVPVSDSH